MITSLAVLFIICLLLAPIAYFAISVHRGRRDRDVRRAAHPYRAPGQEPADPGEAWRAGVREERARVLAIVRTVKGASGDSGVQRACAALAAGIDGGTVGK